MILRARQFPEDQRTIEPTRCGRRVFSEINNFYTATVYEKGAEVIGMLKTLVGDDAYSRALDLYFDRHDGQACTIEDWLQVFADATGRDLAQFKLWYAQSGTPRRRCVGGVVGRGLYPDLQTHTPSTPGQVVKDPKVIPIAVGLLNPNGDEVVPTQVLEMTNAEQSFTFDGLAGKPVPSILRGFSAPIVLEREVSREEQAFLLAHDTDEFNRWEANRNLARDCLVAMIRDGAAPDTAWLDGLERVVRDDALDAAFRALMMALPSQSEMAQVLFELGTTPDPDAIWQAAEDLRNHMAVAWTGFLSDLRGSVVVHDPYAPDADQSGKRSLGSALLGLQTRLDGGAAAQAQYDSADNMTLQLSALSQLISADKGDSAVKSFESQWKDDRLVMDKWFGLQVGMAKPDIAVDVAESLVEHPAFDLTNPNRFRAVMGGFAMNHAGFHRKDGAGYAFLADWLITLDDKNPQTTARMCSVFQTWKRYDEDRQTKIKTALERIKAKPNLSRDTDEMVSRILG